MDTLAAILSLDLTPFRSLVLAYGLILARPVAMMTFLPVFTRVELSAPIRTAVATALALPMLPAVLAALQRDGWSAWGLAALAGKEVAIGFALGIVLGAPFWALDVAGDLLDLQRGATQGRLNDPAGFGDVSIMGTLLLITGVALFVATGGLQTMVDLLYRSWALWGPLGVFPILDARTPVLVLGLLDRVTRQGLTLAMPLIVALLLADAGLLVIARLAPQLKTDDVALSVRNVVFYSVLPLYAAFLIGYVREDLGSLPALLDLMRDAAPMGNGR